MRAAFLLAILTLPATAAVWAQDAAPAPAPKIAILAPENLTGQASDDPAVEASMRGAVSRRGYALLSAEETVAFMTRHRIRYTGGVAPDLGSALRDETGSTAVLIVSITLYEDTEQPKIGLEGRLVSTAEGFPVLWADGVALTWEDRPGFLSLGLVRSGAALREEAASRLADSLDRKLRGMKPSKPDEGQGRFAPRKAFPKKGGILVAGVKPRVAVLPFTNRSGRRRAGDLLAIAFVRELASRDDVVVVEPGVVRQVLLQTRLIPEGGISFSQAELLRGLIEVDYVVSGDVIDYVGLTGEGAVPVIEFTTQVLATRARQVVWSSISHNTGADGVFFFDVGRVRSAPALAGEMTRATVGRMLRPTRGEGVDAPAKAAAYRRSGPPAGYR